MGSSDTITFLNIFISLAVAFSKRSIATDKKVGAIAVDSERNILGYGWNSCPDSNSPSTVDKEGRTKPEVIHAEEALIQKAADNGKSIRGSTVFVTHSPCNHCAGRLIFAGVKRVYFLHLFKGGSGVDLLNQNGIETTQIVLSDGDDPDELLLDDNDEVIA